MRNKKRETGREETDDRVKREREERVRERKKKREEKRSGRTGRSPRKLFINEMAGSAGDDEATGKLHGTGTSLVIPPSKRERERGVSLSCLK